MLGTEALLCTALGLLAAAAAVVVRSRDARESLHVLLDFLLAAGLLRLTGDPGWAGIATAGGIFALRRLLRRSWTARLDLAVVGMADHEGH